MRGREGRKVHGTINVKGVSSQTSLLHKEMVWEFIMKQLLQSLCLHKAAYTHPSGGAKKTEKEQCHCSPTHVATYDGH